MSLGHSIVVYSNCQGEPIRNGLLSVLAAADIPVHLVETYKPFTEVQAKQLSECTILLEQVQKNERCPIEQYLKPGVTRFRFPVVYCTSLWPFAGERGDEPADRPTLFEWPLGDDQFKALWRRGGETEAILDEYEAMDYGALTDLDSVAERNRTAIRDLESRSDVTLWDGIEKRFATEPTFHCFYHPYVAVTYPAVKAAIEFVLGIVGGDTSVVPGALNDWVSNEPSAFQQTPIHPSVARRLGLKWVTRETPHRLRYQGTLTAREFWRAYLTSDVDDGIEKAALLMDTGGGVEALRILDEIPGNSPDRDVVRARALIFGNRFTEGKALAAGAMDRNDPRIFMRYAVDTWLRAAAAESDPNDCLRAAKLADEYPGNAQVQYLAGYTLRRGGWEQRGSDAILRAAELCPVNPIYAENAGHIHDNQGDKAAALASYTRAANFAERHNRDHFVNQAQAYAAQNNAASVSPIDVADAV